jgi:hypothetical protein
MSYDLSSEKKAFGNLLKGNSWKKVHFIYNSVVICCDFFFMYNWELISKIFGQL